MCYCSSLFLIKIVQLYALELFCVYFCFLIVLAKGKLFLSFGSFRQFMLMYIYVKIFLKLELDLNASLNILLYETCL